MIAPLRRRHRLMVLALTAVLPPLIALALIARPEVPAPGPPEALDTAGRGQAIIEGAAGFTVLRAHLRRLPSALEMRLETPLRAPDVLAYFVPGEAAEAGDALPPGARLLGPVSHGRTNVYPLDADADGRLLLYSLGHQTRVDEARLPAGGVR